MRARGRGGAAAAAAGAAAPSPADAVRAASAWGDEVDDFLLGRFRTNRFGVRPRVQLEIMSGGKLRWFLAITAAVLLCYAVLTSYGSDLRWDCVDLCGRPCDPDSAGVGLFGDARDAELAAHACATQADEALPLPAGANATVFSLRTALPFGGRDAGDSGSLGSDGDGLFCASRYDYDVVLAVRLAGLRAHAAGVLAAPPGWSGSGGGGGDDAEIEFYTVATLYVVDPEEAGAAVIRQASQAIWETPVAPGVVGGGGGSSGVGANATHFSIGSLAYPRVAPAPGAGGRYLHYNRVDRRSFGCASLDDDDAGGGSTEWEVARSEPVGDGAEGVWLLRVDVVFPGVVLKADAPSLDAVLLKRSRQYVVAEGSVQLVLLAWCMYLLPYFLWKNFARPSMLGEWLTVQVWIACMLLSLAIYLNPVFLPGLAARGDTSRTARAFVFFEILFPEVYFVVFSGFMQVIPLSVGLQAIRAAWVRVQYKADGTGGGLFIPSLLVAAGCAAGIVEEARRFHPVNGRAEEGLRWSRNTELRAAGMGVLAVGAGVVLVAAIFCRVTLRSTTYTVAKYRVLTYRVFLAYVLPSAVVYSAVTTYRWAPRTRAALHRATRSSPHLQDKLLLSTLILVLSHLFSPVFSVRKNAPPPPHTREWLSTRWRPEWKAWVTEFGKSLYFFITEDEERTYAQAEEAGSVGGASAADAQQPPPGTQAGAAAAPAAAVPAALRRRSGGGSLRRRSAGGGEQQRQQQQQGRKEVEEEEGAVGGENGSACSSSGTGPQATHRSLAEPLTAGAGADREPVHEPIHFYRIGAHEPEDLGLEHSGDAGSGGGVGGSGGGSALLPRAHTSSSSLPSPLATTHAQSLSGTSPALLHDLAEAPPPPGVAKTAAGTEGNVSFAVSTLAVRARSQLLSNLMGDDDDNGSTASTASSGYNTSRSHSRTMPLGQLPPALERTSSFDVFDEEAVEEEEEAAATGDEDDDDGGGGALFQEAGLLSPAPTTGLTSPPVSPPQAPLLQGGKPSLAVLGGLGELEQPALGDVRRAQRRRRMSRHVSPLAGDALLSPYTPMKRLPFVGPVLEGGSSLLFQQTPSSAGEKKDGGDDAKAAAGEGDVSIAIPPSAEESQAKPTAAAATSASGSDAGKKSKAKKKKKKKKDNKKKAKKKPTTQPYGNDSSSSSDDDGAGAEGERHPIFCLESAVECFNASWLSYMPDDKQSFHDSTYLQRGDLDSHVEWFADFSRVPSFLRSTTRAENHAKCVWFLRGVEEAQLHGLPTRMRWVQSWAPGGTRRDLLLGRRGGVVGSRSEAGDWDVPDDRHRLSWRAAEAWRGVAQLLRASVEDFEAECRAAPASPAASPPSSPVRARSAEGSPTRSGRGGGGEDAAEEEKDGAGSPASVARRPVWQDDKSCERCPQPGCSARFSLTTRKHHCRRCGRIFCEQHTRGRAALPALGYPEPVRVCAACVVAMREGQKAERAATRAAESPPCERASARWSELLRALKERLKGVRRAKLFLSHEAGGGAGGAAAEAEAGADDAGATSAAAAAEAQIPHTSAEDFSQRAAFLMGQVWVMCNAPHKCRPPPASRRGSKRNVNNLRLSGLGGVEEDDEEGKAAACAAAVAPAAAVAAVVCVVVESVFCSIPGQRAVFAMLVRDLAVLLGGGLGTEGAAAAAAAAPFARPFVACDLLSEEGIAHFGGSTGVVVEALELLKRCDVLEGGEEDSPPERGHRSRSLRVSFDGSRWRLRPAAARAVVAECGVDAGWAEAAAAAGGGELARWSRVRLAMMMSSVSAYPGHALPRCVEMSELGGVPGFELGEEPIHAEFYGYKLEAAVTVRSCDLKAIVLSSPSRVVVAFRGTDSTANVMVDIALCPAEFKPHDGFLSMFGNAKTAVEKTVCCACCSAPPSDPRRRENADAAAEDGVGGRSARCCGPGFVKARLGHYHRALFGKKPEVHLGFLSAWQAMEQDVLHVLSNVCPVDDPRPLFCTGHSLGGAMAQIAAYSLTWKLYELQKQPRVYVFGCPRVGNFNFALAYNALVPDTFRVNVNGDPFTNVPPSFGRARYWHAGVEVHLSRHERVSWCIDPTWLDSGCIPMPYPLSHLMRNIKKQLNRMMLLFNPRFLAFNKALVPAGMGPKYLKYIVDDAPNEEGLKRTGYFWPWCRVTRPDISSLAAEAAAKPVPLCCESASGGSSAE